MVEGEIKLKFSGMGPKLLKPYMLKNITKPQSFSFLAAFIYFCILFSFHSPQLLCQFASNELLLLTADPMHFMQVPLLGGAGHAGGTPGMRWLFSVA